MSIRSYKGATPRIHPSTYIDASAVIIGDVVIGEDCSIWPMCVLRGDVNSITIGSRTNIQDGCILHVTHDSKISPGGFPLKIGDGVTAGHRATLHGCTIGDHCLIGMSATVMDGAIINDSSILGAGSLVTPGKELEGGYLYMGSPVKKIRPLTDQELELLEYSAAHYMKLKNEYLGSDSG